MRGFSASFLVLSFLRSGFGEMGWVPWIARRLVQNRVFISDAATQRLQLSLKRIPKITKSQLSDTAERHPDETGWGPRSVVVAAALHPSQPAHALLPASPARPMLADAPRSASCGLCVVACGGRNEAAAPKYAVEQNTRKHVRGSPSRPWLPLPLARG